MGEPQPDNPQNGANSSPYQMDRMQNLIREFHSVNSDLRNIIMAGWRPNSEASEQVQVGAPPQDIVLNMDGQNEQDFEQEQPNNNQTENQTPIEVQEYIRGILKYIPFILILWAKALYDYYYNIFIVLFLFVISYHANSCVKKEATKQHRRTVSTLCIELFYIASCMVFILLVYGEENMGFNLLLNMVLIRTFTTPLDVCSLLWIVTLTDFSLKIITIALKVLLTMLPGSFVDFKKRGKLYLFLEATSQMYRSIATIQPWLFYLLESYQGPEKIVAVFLSAFYILSKGNDLMAKLVFLKQSWFKLLQNVAIGTSPSKEQIQNAGENCPICHDEYDCPVLLQCKHIFCESCVTTWFDREQNCPLCRAKIVDDPSWRDGSTSHFVQLF